MESIFSVRDKVIVITGATGILGKAMASALAIAGAQVGVMGRNENKTDALVDRLTIDGHAAFEFRWQPHRSWQHHHITYPYGQIWQS